jgi:hypothetical protein
VRRTGRPAEGPACSHHRSRAAAAGEEARRRRPGLAAGTESARGWGRSSGRRRLGEGRRTAAPGEGLGRGSMLGVHIRSASVLARRYTRV